MSEPDQEIFEKLYQEVRAASDVYRRAASEYKKAIEDAKARGWRPDSDGEFALHSAGVLERQALERYKKVLEGLTAVITNGRKPKKRPGAESSKSNENRLTPRETQILRLIAVGFSSRQISDKLQISFKTVVVHRYHMMAKLDLHDVASLVRYAIRNKLVKP